MTGFSPGGEAGLAIQVEGLGKRYYLGLQDRYQTLRDLISRSAERTVREVSDGLRRLAGRPPAPTNGGEYLWALRNVSLSIRPGEVLGIVGRNGGGKSTLLKVLARVTEPTEGWAEIRGRVAALLEVGAGFHPELSGRENVILNGTIMGLSPKEIDERFDAIHAFSEIEKFIDVPVKRYSTGMRMRLAFSIAAHLDPEILLVDEVLAVGDYAFQAKCIAKMRAFARSGRTVLFVSHNLDAVHDLCHRAIWIDHGGVARQGGVDEVLDAYKNAPPICRIE